MLKIFVLGLAAVSGITSKGRDSIGPNGMELGKQSFIKGQLKDNELPLDSIA